MNISIIVESMKYIINYEKVQVTNWLWQLIIENNYTDSKLFKAFASSRLDIVKSIVHLVKDVEILNTYLRANAYYLDSNIILLLIENGANILELLVNEIIDLNVLKCSKLMMIILDSGSEIKSSWIETCIRVGLSETLKLLLERYNGPTRRIIVEASNYYWNIHRSKETLNILLQYEKFHTWKMFSNLVHYDTELALKIIDKMVYADALQVSVNCNNYKCVKHILENNYVSRKLYIKFLKTSKDAKMRDLLRKYLHKQAL